MISISFLFQTKPTEGVTYVPVLNIVKEDYRLRTEVTYFLKLHNITSNDLVFRDDINLIELHNRGQLRLTLVDWNMLRGQDQELEDTVKEVIDHHQLERTSCDK